jgi:predicted amidohydrolase
MTVMKNDNMLPDVFSEQWKPWFQRAELAPIFEKTEQDGVNVLKTSSTRFEQFGKWLCESTEISENETYRFSVDIKTEAISHETVTLHVMLTWQDLEGTPLTRDFADCIRDIGDGWKSISRTLDAPEKAVSLTVELVYKWSEKGSVCWRRPVLERAEPVRHRIVKVASAFIRRTETLEGNLEQMLRMIDKAGAEKADVICLGETVYDWGTNLPVSQSAVAIPGPVTDILAERARKHNMYIILSMNEKEGDYYYNAGVLIDRKGNIAGKSRKVQLPLCEGEDGMTPGSGYPVFDTDFGRIAIMICFELGFPEVSRILAMKGAEIIFVPTLGVSDIEIHAPSRAAENGVYIVVSGRRVSNYPCIVYSPAGEAIASVTGRDYNEEGLCTATLDLDKRFYVYWFSVGAANGESKNCYMQSRRSDTYGMLTS